MGEDSAEDEALVQEMRLVMITKKWRGVAALARKLESAATSVWRGRGSRPSRHWLDFYSQFIRSGDLCFDVGAHVGERTDILLALGARVVSVDPQPGCAETLRRKYRREPRVTVIEKGLAATPGEMMLAVCESAPTISTFSEKWKTGRFRQYSWDSHVRVEMTTLDVLVQEFGSPVFCKVDVEGFEYQVLKGLTSGIPLLSFEFTKEFLEDARMSLEHLQTLGDPRCNYALGDSAELGIPEWVDAPVVVDKLMSLHDDDLWGDIYVTYAEGPGPVVS